MLLTVGDIPALWEQYREHISRTMECTAVIAGGCLRDLENNKQVRDVDIFTNINQRRIRDITYHVGFHPRNVLTDSYGNNLTGEFSFSAEYDLGTFNTKLNVIGIKNPNDDPAFYIERFDFGLCQIYYDGNELHKTPAYIKDQENHTWTLIRCENQDQFNRSMKRWENKFKNKYRDWELVIPDEFSIYTDKEIQWLVNNNRGWYNLLHGKSVVEEDFRKGILQDQPSEFR